jgi:hypothetical protein
MNTMERSVAGASLALLLLAACESTPPKPMAPIEDTIEVSATVQKVDVLNRLLSFKTESGEIATVAVGPEVENLVQVREGDRLVVRYRQAIGATIATTAGQSVTVDVEADKAKLGERPRASASTTTNVPVTIASVDTKTNLVSFYGADGLVRAITVQTPQAKEFIKQLKPGDNVIVSYTEAAAVSIEPAK